MTGKLDTQWRLEDRTLYLQASNSWLDWVLDFTAFSVPVRPYKGMSEPFLAHLGFLSAYRANAEAIQSLAFDRIVGYSLGAALGLLVHEDQLWRTGRAPETHLFGCPAAIMTNSASLAGRWERVTRYDCPGDLVAKALTWIGYTHVGGRVVLGGAPRRPEGMSWITWRSGHTPSEYRQRLALL